MKKVYIISKLGYWITQILTGFYILIVVYAAFVLGFKNSALSIIDNGERFQIFFPFTKQPFLLGFYNALYILVRFFLVMICYGAFFWLLSRVFDVFTKEKLFTQKAYQRLRRFYIINLCAPIVLLVLFHFLFSVDKGDTMIVFLHMLLGVFIFFLAAIFKKGLTLQENQDLII